MKHSFHDEQMIEHRNAFVSCGKWYIIMVYHGIGYVYYQLLTFHAKTTWCSLLLHTLIPIQQFKMYLLHVCILDGSMVDLQKVYYL